MRISDWSSDVCSSDLIAVGNAGAAAELAQHVDEQEEAESAARASFCRTIGLAEILEHFRAEARPAVGDLDHQHVDVARCGEAGQVGRKLGRIGEDVVDDLAKRRTRPGRRGRNAEGRGGGNKWRSLWM